MYSGHQIAWSDLPMLFTRDFVTRENYWQIASLVTQKIVIHGYWCIILYIIIVVIFMMCRFYENAGFTWSSSHAGVVRLLLETCAEILTILPTSSKHVSLGTGFPGLGIGDMSYQRCMTLRIGTNNIVGGSIKAWEGGHGWPLTEKTSIYIYIYMCVCVCVYCLYLV